MEVLKMTKFHISIPLLNEYLKRGEKGVSLQMPSSADVPFSFALVDRATDLSFLSRSEIDVVEISVVREITDRRGKKVPIVKISPHYHQWVEKDGGCYCPVCQKKLWHTPASAPVVEKIENEFEVVELLHYTCARCNGQWVQERRYKKISSLELNFLREKLQEVKKEVARWIKVQQWLQQRASKYEKFMSGVEIETSEGKYRVRWGVYHPIVEKYTSGSYSLLLWNDDTATEQIQKPVMAKGWHWEEIKDPEELGNFETYLSQAQKARERYVKIETLIERTYQKASPWRTVSRELEELLSRFKWNTVEAEELVGGTVLESLLNRIRRFYPDKVEFFEKVFAGELSELSYRGKPLKKLKTD